MSAMELFWCTKHMEQTLLHRLVIASYSLTPAPPGSYIHSTDKMEKLIVILPGHSPGENGSFEMLCIYGGQDMPGPTPASLVLTPLHPAMDSSAQVCGEDLTPPHLAMVSSAQVCEGVSGGTCTAPGARLAIASYSCVTSE